MSDLQLILLIALAILVLWLIHKFGVKNLKTGSMVLVTGGLKTGKSTLSVYLAVRSHKRALLKYRLKHIFFKNEEMPYLYSNIPLNYKYYKPLTKAHLERKIRFEYHSTVYICEASLVADSMSYKDAELNERLLLFNKLFAHEIKSGGSLVYDTQSISDNHYAVKRCLNSYFYIQKSFKFIPFFIAMKICEYRYSDDGSVVSVSDKDVDNDTKWCLVPKSVWKRFDCHCYSCFTDNLDISNIKVGKLTKNDLKARKIISFKNYDTLKEFVVEGDK